MGPRIVVEYFDMVKLAMDDEPVAFSSATIAMSVEWTETEEGVSTRGPSNWRGQIVSETLDPNLDDLVVPHLLVGLTDQGRPVAGKFMIARVGARGVEFEGAGPLRVI